MHSIPSTGLPDVTWQGALPLFPGWRFPVPGSQAEGTACTESPHWQTPEHGSHVLMGLRGLSRRGIVTGQGSAHLLSAPRPTSPAVPGGSPGKSPQVRGHAKPRGCPHAPARSASSTPAALPSWRDTAQSRWRGVCTESGQRSHGPSSPGTTSGGGQRGEGPGGQGRWPLRGPRGRARRGVWPQRSSRAHPVPPLVTEDATARPWF